MGNLRLPARLYIAALALAALGLSVVTLSHAVVPSLEWVLLALAFAALMTIASFFWLPFAPKARVTLDTSVIFAAILLFQPGVAILIAASGKSLAQAIQRQPWYQLVFNVAQTMLQAGVGGLILMSAGWDVHQLHFDRPQQLLMIAVAAVAIYIINTLSVAVVIALRSGRRMLPLWRQLAHSVVMDHVSQLVLGLLAASVVDAHPWTLPLFLLPGFVFYRSLERNVQLRKWADEALRSSEASLAHAQRIAHLGSWAWDAAMDRFQWSDEAYRIFGYTPLEFVPTYDTFLNDSVHPDDRAHVQEALQAVLRGQGHFDLDHRIVLPDGSQRIVHEQGEVTFDGAGKPIRAVGTVHDITERKLAEAQREELLARVEDALEFRNQFLSITSHELRTPITILKGYAQLAYNRTQEMGQVRILKPLQIINRQADLMAQLIDDLLDISRIESGKLQFENLPFDLNSALEEVVQEVALGASDFRLNLDEQPGHICVRGDRRRLQQVITNVLTNAVKYSKDRKEVDIHIRREGGLAMVRVTDYGIGIPSQQLSHAFDLYFRGSNVPVNSSGGLGLGLYISKALVEHHGGTMGATSVEGSGSTFYFSLPVSNPAIPAQDLVTSAPDRSNPK